jgi:hypothetical protein
MKILKYLNFCIGALANVPLHYFSVSLRSDVAARQLNKHYPCKPLSFTCSLPVPHALLVQLLSILPCSPSSLASGC